MKQSGVDRDLLIVGNTMFDVKKIGGCSTLIVEPDRSATGGPLFGRNLDFPTLGRPGEVQPGDRLPTRREARLRQRSASPACSAACRA